jgi:calcineurin-like phosphoesterase family protein
MTNIIEKKNYFVIADTHWGHKNILSFLRDDGTPGRPGFSSVEEMDEIMIQNWNSVVKNDNDRVYHLGDVTFDYSKFCNEIAPRLKGQKRLIIGNHDKLKGTKLMDCFKRVEYWASIEDLGICMSHLPMMREQFRGKCTRNVHGHIHHRSMNSPIHACVSVEWTNCTPVNMEDIDKYFGLIGEPVRGNEIER